MKRLLFLYLPILALSTVIGARAQLSPDSDLYQLLKSGDSLWSHAAINCCDGSTPEQLVADDFEFYHDNSGVTKGREEFVSPFRDQCASGEPSKPQPAGRILLPESPEVFPLYKKGVLYGALQQGRHKLVFLNEDQQYQWGDLVRFTYLWVIEGTSREINRELSYDHQSDTDNR